MDKRPIFKTVEDDTIEKHDTSLKKRGDDHKRVHTKASEGIAILHTKIQLSRCSYEQCDIQRTVQFSGVFRNNVFAALSELNTVAGQGIEPY